MLKMKKGTPRKNRGVTLIEVMISFAIMAIALFALLQVSASSDSLRSFQAEYNLARGAVMAKSAEINSRADALLDTSSDFATDFQNYLLTQATWTSSNVKRSTGQAATGTVQFYRNTALTDNQHPIFGIYVSLTWAGVKGQQTYTFRFTVTR